jgi:hypothetical protein
LRANSPVVSYIAGGISLIIVIWAIWRSKSERVSLAATIESAEDEAKEVKK